MPAGAVGYTTFAVEPVGGDDETAFHTFTIPANTVAWPARMSSPWNCTRASANSSDLRFDLSLTGTASGVAATLNGNTRVHARVLYGSTWSALADATFQVAYPLVANGPYSARFLERDRGRRNLSAQHDLPANLGDDSRSRPRCVHGKPVGAAL